MVMRRDYRGGGYRRPYRIGPLIRDVLVEMGDEAYPMFVHATLKERIRMAWVQAAEAETPEGEAVRVKRHQVPAYITVRTYLNAARRHGLVEYTGETRASANPDFEDVRFIRITPGAAADPAWDTLLLPGGSETAPPQAPEVSQGVARRQEARFEADPAELRRLYADFQEGLLTSEEYSDAVELLASGRVTTARGASQLSIRKSQRTQAELAAPQARATPTSPVAIAWAAVVDKIQGYARPNSGAAEKALDAFVEAATEAGVREDDLDDVLSTPRAALEEYRASEPEDRSDAWDAFIESLGEVDWSELEQGE